MIIDLGLEPNLIRDEANLLVLE